MASSMRSKLAVLVQDIPITSAAVDALDLLHQELLSRLALRLAEEAAADGARAASKNAPYTMQETLVDLGLSEAAEQAMNAAETIKQKKRKRSRKINTEELLAEQERLLQASKQRMEDNAQKIISSSSNTKNAT